MASISRYIPFFFRPSRLGPSRSLLLGLTLGFSLSLSLTGLAIWSLNAFKRRLTKDVLERIVEIRENEVLEGVEGLIGTFVSGMMKVGKGWQRSLRARTRADSYLRGQAIPP